jgi:hypothetical protein
VIPTLRERERQQRGKARRVVVIVPARSGAVGTVPASKSCDVKTSHHVMRVAVA